MPQPDPFDDLLTLEDTLYTSAYSLGTQDGAHAGRIEGRIFGLEKGFDKFAALGALHGRAVVWGARLSPQAKPEQVKENDGFVETDTRLPTLPQNDRLKKHIHTLHALSDPLTFSTLNTEDAVADYDDRFKRAGAKAKIIERITASNPPLSTVQLSPNASASQAKGRARGVRLSGEERKKGDDSMEDFSGSRFLS